jgi:SAM-dependent methyltransferase
MRPEGLPKWPLHGAAPGTHDQAYRMVLKHVPQPAGVRVLDVPCGGGLFAKRLAELGMDVSAMDIEHVEPFQFDMARRTLGDCNKGLPYADAAFGLVVTIEGIEHLENPSMFVRECARVLKPGGTVVLTTPNPDSFRSRRYVFTRGFNKYFHAVTDTMKDRGHLLPVDMIFMHGACERAGLQIVETTVNRMSGRNPFTEMLRPLFTRKLPAYLRGPVPFYGEVIIYVLRKPG